MSSSSSPVRIAIIGTGGISAAHARGILQHAEKVVCVALCDLSEANLKARSDQLGGIAAQYSDWNQMLDKQGDEIDAVLICLPHHLHAPAIVDVVGAKKHVLCEKPLCIDLEEADRIVETVESSGVVFMPAHNQLFMPSVRKAKQIVESGSLGPVFWLRSQDCFRAGGFSRDAWRASAKLQGGGELIDTGYHPTYRLLYLAGAEVSGLRASMGRFHLGDLEGEDTASVQLRFANGAIGEVLSSWAFRVPYGSHAIHVIGKEGQLFGGGDALYFLPNGYEEPARMKLVGGDTFSDQMAYFADCVSGRAKLLHTVRDSRTVLQVIVKAAEDASGWQERAQLKWVPLVN